MMGTLRPPNRPPNKIYRSIAGVVQSVVPGGMFVMLTYPEFSGDATEHRARFPLDLLVPRHGVVRRPQSGDAVLVQFEHGDLDRPYVIGYLWNDKDKPPATAGKAKRPSPAAVRTGPKR